MIETAEGRVNRFHEAIRAEDPSTKGPRWPIMSSGPRPIDATSPFRGHSDEGGISRRSVLVAFTTLRFCFAVMLNFPKHPPATPAPHSGHRDQHRPPPADPRPVIPRPQPRNLSASSPSCTSMVAAEAAAAGDFSFVEMTPGGIGRTERMCQRASDSRGDSSGLSVRMTGS